MNNKEKLLKDFKFFESKLDGLLKSDSNKFAVIKNEEILKICKSNEDALNFAKEQKIELGTFLIQEITKNNTQYISRLAV